MRPCQVNLVVLLNRCNGFNYRSLEHILEEKISGRHIGPKLRTFGTCGCALDGVTKKATEARLLRWRKAFASVLAASRRDADLTQSQVAEAMGWARNTVTKIEGGSRSLAVEELMELCRLYRVEPTVLLGRVQRW